MKAAVPNSTGRAKFPVALAKAERVRLQAFGNPSRQRGFESSLQLMWLKHSILKKKSFSLSAIANAQTQRQLI